MPRDLALADSQVTTVPDEPPAGTLVQEKTLSFRVPYNPQPFLNSDPIDFNNPGAMYFAGEVAAAQSVYLPIYIGGVANIKKVTTSYYDDDGLVKTRDATYTTDCNITSNPENDLAVDTWCIQNNASYTRNYDVFHVHGNPSPDGAKEWDYGGFTITFNSINTVNYRYLAGDPMNPGADTEKTIQMGGGNTLYYTTKLARLELLGVPQIFYEPLYCNTNREELVEGIFDASPSTRSAFEDNNYSWFYDSDLNDVDLNQIYDPKLPDGELDFANPLSKVTYQDKVIIPQVWSSREFSCCLNLGKGTDVSANCCSNYSVEETKDGKVSRVCALPRGADLHLYYNRFISGDGVGETQPGGGLVDTDFIPLTGEPRVNDDVQKKIRALGEAFCGSKVVRGGAAFGYFFAQPNNGYFKF